MLLPVINKVGVDSVFNHLLTTMSRPAQLDVRSDIWCRQEPIVVRICRNVVMCDRGF